MWAFYYLATFLAFASAFTGGETVDLHLNVVLYRTTEGFGLKEPKILFYEVFSL